ncbi:formimidoylglutamate deiminase [Aquimarina sp. 2201CG5-10]|uniref:formimidoylglutamate deiminase n=1 Tax=Aquimarina callyspongiae TaxID=3098150 RepID=UPI002AB4C0BB|nr:formimidoylglutamate deiminase [Aquimarina sp. 2201CG5-10]MDY8136332.1 formimidoylglutamate deiminase [Aquimarina sp. 2201CG5-10]
MKTYHLKGVLQKTGWTENISITVDDNGIITNISPFKEDTQKDIISGYAVPGFQNAHSHAFQYAMAGLAEQHEGTSNPDDFWGWRKAMYQLALSMNPDQMEAIATMLYSEMARHGYTNVAEFHYVHHDKNGKPYTDLAEMGGRLVNAAKTAGIGITLIPIFYQKGGFGVAPTEKQRRFISPTIDEYLKLLEASENACKNYKNANIGIGIHSMRGVEPSDIAKIAESGPQNIPFHIHVSEQLKEIEDSIKYLNKRPVEWLLENIELNERFQLVHATHLTDQETLELAKTQANVVICPSTEGNLGDGIFPLRKYQAANGKWSIGTDSHVGLNPLEELRILDYGQRLTSHKRNTYFSQDQTDSGMYAITMATLMGQKAMNNNYSKDFFEVGKPLNASIFDASAPLLATSSLQNLTSTIVYSSDPTMQLATISYGEMIVNKGIHFKKENIKTQFIEAINALKNR